MKINNINLSIFKSEKKVDDQRRKKFREKNYRDYISRKSQYNYTAIYCNNAPISINVTRIKNKDELNENVAPLDWERSNVVYLLANQREISTTGFIRGYDFIICDVSWRIVKIHQAVKPGEHFNFGGRLFHLWILPSNTANHYGFKLDQKLFVASDSVY